MVRNSQIIMFLLYTFVFPVDPTVQGMALVNVCPKTELDVIQASKRLGCGNDTYGNNQYMCVPNKEKTSLVEFCFQGVMGIREKGNCLELSEGEVIRHSCNQFSYGCPETNFYDYDIYKYPECQNINAKMQCYVLDRNCTVNSNTGEPEEKSGQNNVIYYISILGSALVFIVCLIILVLCYKRRTNIRMQSDVDIEHQRPLSGDENVRDNIRLILFDKAGSKKRAILRNTGKTCITSPKKSSCSETSAVYSGKKIHIFDSSKFFDTTNGNGNGNIQREILECISITSPGPHAIILVLNIAKGIEEELKCVQHLVTIFGEKIYEHFIVLLKKKDYHDYITKKGDRALLTMYDKCENRVMEFDNKLKSKYRDEQLSTLLEKVSDVENKNGERYRNEIYEQARNFGKRNQ